jgi:hypothetical protein
LTAATIRRKQTPGEIHNGRKRINNNDRQGHGRPRDRVIDEAKAALMERFFREGTKEVYYGRQIEFALENDFFHWITKRAFPSLRDAGPSVSQEGWIPTLRQDRCSVRDGAQSAVQHRDGVLQRIGGQAD